MPDDIETPAPHAAFPKPLAAWHLIWTLAVLLGGLAVNAAAGGLTVAVAFALVAGLIPGIVVLVLSRLDEEGRRVRLLFPIWAVCGAVAAILTGGLGGPMAAWCLAPLVLGWAIGTRGFAGLGTACTVLAVLAVAFAQLSGGVDPGPAGMSGFVLGLTALGSLVLAAGGAYVAPRLEPPEPAETSLGLLDVQPQLVFKVNPENIVSDLHGRFSSGLKPGRSITALAAGEDAARLAQSLVAARGGEPQSMAFAPQSDLDRWWRLDLAPLAGGALSAVLRDETAIRDREEGLEAARADAENLAAGKSRFLASMSHELRTPLNAIMGFSDIMRNRMFGELPGKYVEYAELIHESGAHLLDLISDVLDMSKIEAHRFELNTEPHDAREPVSAALRILRHQADEAEVHLRANLPTAPLEVDADRRALKQIVINLVSNALKFTPAGGSVIVGLAAREENLELTVADTGVGIAPEDLARLGRPYEQAGDATRRARGTGLGLSLVRAFAELHGGQMVIESRLGEGTAVTVTMPVLQTSEQAAPAPDNVIAFSPQR